MNNYNKLIINLIILMVIIFTAVVLVVFSKVGSEPSTLIMSFFGFVTGELWFLAGIKKRKIMAGEGREDE